MNLVHLALFAQYQEASPAPPLLAIIVGVFVFLVLPLAGLWGIFAKAGQPGWAAIIPIYNTIVLLQVTGKPIWWIILLFIPCVSVIVILILFLSLAERFGKGAGFGLGIFLFPFIFLPVLGFGAAQYKPAISS